VRFKRAQRGKSSGSCHASYGRRRNARHDVIIIAKSIKNRLLFEAGFFGLNGKVFSLPKTIIFQFKIFIFLPKQLIMKILITAAVLLFSLFTATSQEVKYQIYKAQLKLSASKEGEDFQWTNNNIAVTLNYKTGDFILKLKNSDFKETLENRNTVTQETETVKDTEYLFKGMFPINSIIDQQSINQTYPIELQLICDDPEIDKTVNFKMDITYPGSGQYRIFTLNGKLYNDELNIPVFTGFDNEIELWIVFNAFVSN
jgi:hypothetical protein